jgi:hypothetical protein
MKGSYKTRTVKVDQHKQCRVGRRVLYHPKTLQNKKLYAIYRAIVGASPY